MGQDRLTRHAGGFASRAAGTDEGAELLAVLRPQAAPAQMRSGQSSGSALCAQLLGAELRL